MSETSPAPPQPDNRGTAEITLVDEDGEPVVDMRVSLFAQAVRGDRQLGDATTGSRASARSPTPSQALNLLARAYDETLKVIAQSATVLCCARAGADQVHHGRGRGGAHPIVYTTLVTAVASSFRDRR